ncbi:hypothetical protein EJ110_NYTH10032 [Nymphaea thermarum]|nr:hypothetical protein EJ110_NYTH10032 [Nymphaea thermarum]
MGNSLRCCISCMLPCGALDVVRIVHSNGHVEEMSGDVCAGDVMKANPKHVLRKHCPEGVRIIVLPPDAQLKRGHIYFLSPVSSASSSPAADASGGNFSAIGAARSKRKKGQFHEDDEKISSNDSLKTPARKSKVSSQHGGYLVEILSEKKSSFGRGRRRGRVGIWRPHLESISEDF